MEELVRQAVERPQEMPPLIVTASDVDPALHGRAFTDAFCSRLGVVDDDRQLPVAYLISTTMDPG